MSRYESESGTILLPSTDFARVRAAVAAEHDRIQDERFERARRAHAALVAAKRGAPRGTTHATLFVRLFADDGRAWELAQALFLDASRSKLRTPRRSDYPHATRKTVSFDVDGEATITFDGRRRAVTWDVPENNHACERAHEASLAKVFFGALSHVRWPSRGASGGVIAGNDEYNRASRAAGGGANYVTARFGPAGRDAECERRGARSASAGGR